MGAHGVENHDSFNGHRRPAHAAQIGVMLHRSKNPLI
jgi:hypothetical protein